MAGIITASDLTFNGEEIKDLSEAIMTETFSKPSITEFHTLVTGIEAKKQIAILGLFGLVGKTSTGCAPDENPGTITMSQKFWNPVYIEDRFAQCWKDLRGTFFVWGLKKGVQKGDLTSTDFANFLEERLSDAIKEAVLRLAWFGDTAADTYAGTGFITNGTTLGYFNALDGLWKQIFAVVAGNAAQKVAIAKNAAATYALQKFDSTDTTNQLVTGYFQTMLETADLRLSESPNKVFIVTKSVADQYKRERKAFSNIDLAYTRIEKGWDMLEVDGVKIYVFSFWDRMITTYENNGTKYHLPHRIVLTTIENIQIGTEEEGTLSELKPFYVEKDNKYYVDFGFNLDAKFIENYKGMFAY